MGVPSTAYVCGVLVLLQGVYCTTKPTLVHTSHSHSSKTQTTTIPATTTATKTSTSAATKLTTPSSTTSTPVTMTTVSMTTALTSDQTTVSTTSKSSTQSSTVSNPPSTTRTTTTPSTIGSTTTAHFPRLVTIDNKVVWMLINCTVGDLSTCPPGFCCTKELLNYATSVSGVKIDYQLGCQPLRRAGETCYFHTPENFCPCATQCHTNGFYGYCT